MWVETRRRYATESESKRADDNDAKSWFWNRPRVAEATVDGELSTQELAVNIDRNKAAVMYFIATIAPHKFVVGCLL